MKTKRIFYAIICVCSLTLIFSSCSKSDTSNSDNDNNNNDNNPTGSSTNDKTTAVFNPNLIYGTMTDIDGNVYKTIKIGTQTWMAENLRTTKYNDNSNIPAGEFCSYNNCKNVDTIATFGRYYSYSVATSGKLAPIGWHVPTEDEFAYFKSFLGVDYGGNSVSIMMESGNRHWLSGKGNNQSGFTALPAGQATDNNNGFQEINNSAYWWSTGSDVVEYFISGNDDYLKDYSLQVSLHGFYRLSIRCIQDAPVTASFTADKESGNAPLSVQFTNTSINAVSYDWDFGDGSTSVEKDPLHTFTNQTASSKTFTVTLSCKAADNSTSNATKAITVYKSILSPILFNPDLTYNTMTDQDGNVYKTITIGTQTWMAENLRTTHFNDGTEIPNVKGGSVIWANVSGHEPAWCTYENTTNDDSIKVFGRLYNWRAVNTGKLAPNGWHVSTNAEWQTLFSYLVYNGSGDKMKETGTTHWTYPNDGATNESGFTALPSGLCDGSNGLFYDMGAGFSCWTSTAYDDKASAYFIGANMNGTAKDRKNGYSVRCVKD